MTNPSEVDGEIFADLISDNVDPIDENPQETEPVDVPDNDLLDESDNNPDDSTDVTPTAEPTSDYMHEFLKGYGIDNGIITFENEDGTTEEVNFHDLEDSEKLNILKELSTPNLSEDEVATINYLRKNNATIQDVVEYYSQKAVEDYINKNGTTEKQYSVDAYTDDELFIADLKNKYSDMTDEEIQADLNSAKENEALFKKKVDIIRNQYKQQEEEREKESVRQQEEQYKSFVNTVYNQIADFNEVSMDYRDSTSDSLQIEDFEKNAIYDYILKRDSEGTTQFFKDINDPKKLVEMAWFTLYGKDAISDISTYWKTQLKNSRKQDVKTQSKPQTVVKKDVKPKDNYTHHRDTITIPGGEFLL